jgi:hypothetical protein
MTRLPTPGRDDGVWGEILNDFLAQAHAADGQLRPLSQAQIINLSRDLANKADDAAVVHNDGSETVSGDLTFPQQPARTGQITMYAVNDPGGFTQKNIIFHDMGDLSRGGPVWVDANGRVQAWFGWHDKIPSGASHHGVEVKTSSDPNGTDPTNLVTRFRLKSDADQTQAAFYSCSMLYIENGINSPGTQFGITFNTPQSGSVAANTASSSNYTLGKLTVSVDGSGVATMDIAAGLDNTTGSRICLFRDANNPSASFAVYAADGTATQTFLVDAKTGNITLTGRLQYKNASGAGLFNVMPSLDGASNITVDNDVQTTDASHSATYRVFRNTNTTGGRLFRILKGDGTNTDSFVVNAATGDVTATGNLSVSGAVSASNVFGEDELRRSSNVSTMGRLLAASNLNLTSGTVYGVVAYAKAAGTFTKIRFATGSTAPSGLTEVRLGVYNTSNILLGSTADIHTTIISASALYDSIALDTPITTTAGQQFYLAIAYTGASLQVKGSALPAGMSGLAPVLSKAAVYSGGALPSFGGSANGNVAWIELVP